MIGHKLPNKTKSDTVAEPKLFHQLNSLVVTPTKNNPVREAEVWLMLMFTLKWCCITSAQCVLGTGPITKQGASATRFIAYSRACSSV
jgi:hypothetical protein